MSPSAPARGAAPAPVPPPAPSGRRRRRLRRIVASLRLRLTLTYVILVALLLGGLGVYQYLALQRDLVDTRVSALQGDMADGVSILAGQVSASAKVMPPATSHRNPDLFRAEQVRAILCANIPNGTTTTVGAPTTAAGVRSAVRRVDADALACAIARSSGRTVAVIVYARNLSPQSSAGQALGDIPRIDSGALQTALGGRRSDPHVLPGQGGRQLVVAFPIGGARQVAVDGVVQLSTSTAPIDDVLSGERVQLAAGGGAVLLLTLLAGLLLTGGALAPLRRLTETARSLAHGDLRARSRIPPRDDEVGTLAHSFDEMADRIEAAFAAQAESESRMRRFIADASHELRTPITALKGYIDVLRRGVSRDPEALDAALGAMSREAERMRVLVTDLLTLARLDASRPVEIAPVDLAAIVAGVLDEGVPGMPPRLDRDLAAGLPPVLGDRAAIITVARNLLVNSCKYAPGAPQAWSTGVVAGRAFLRVADSGPGIAAADLPHVFERFYRGEKTRAREEGGSGLGLSIVQGLARAMGGDAAIESTEGAGTVVTVWFAPATEAADEEAHAVRAVDGTAPPPAPSPAAPEAPTAAFPTWTPPPSPDGRSPSSTPAPVTD